MFVAALIGGHLMDGELTEIINFVGKHTPFHHLDMPVLEQLVRQLEIIYVRRGRIVLASGDTNTYLYIIRSGAVELRDSDESLIARLGEGECFGYPSLLTRGEVTRQVTAIEDGLLYRLPEATFHDLRSQVRVFDQFFSEAHAERVRQALGELRTSGYDNPNLMSMTLRELVARAPVTIGPEDTIQDAAKKMSEARVSSLLVVSAGVLQGIVTDRDLRSRVVATGRDLTEPVSTIMTANPTTMPGSALAFEAFMTMTSHGIHHLPVVAETTPETSTETSAIAVSGAVSNSSRIIGLITTTDLVQQVSDNPVYLVGDIRKQDDVAELAQLSKRRREVFLNLITADATAYDVGRVLSLIADATAQQLLRLAERELGTPPVPYAFLVFGSQARQEQSVHSDQDNALLIADEMRYDHDSYFSKLATFVSDGLNACGYDYCPGKVMATNDHWRQPLSVWKDYFSTWTHHPEPEALMNASIFFDVRAIYGDTSLLTPLLEHIRENVTAPMFLGYMAKNALDHQPPLGFFRNFVLERGGNHEKALNLKHRGVVPVIDLARVHSLASQAVTTMNTRDRLEQAASAGALSSDGMDNLRDALEFIGFVRLRHQAEQLQRGETPDNFLAPDNLSQFERNHLKDAFQVVSTMQSALEKRYQATRLG
jgi:CBS domain-containing protein